MKKIIFLLIIIIMLLPLLPACGGEKGSEPDNNVIEPDGGKNNGVAENTEMPEENISTGYTDDLGEFDFDGYEFSMLTRLNPRYTSPINIEEEIGEVLNDAIYRRSRNLEERFNFTFTEQLHTVDSGESKAKKSILAGDNEFDLITLHISVTFPMAQEGMLHPVSDLPYIDLNKPYWNQQLNSDLSIVGKQFFAFGAHDLSSYDFTRMMLFNKAMLHDYGMDNPYELVRSGKWTFDKFGEMSKTAVTDMDGNGIMDKNDRFGFLAADNQVLPNLWISGGARSIKKDNNGVPYSAMADEQFTTVFNKIYEITWDNNSWYGPGPGDMDGTFENMFESGQGLFLDTTFYFIHSLRGMETDFGILPYPKYTETQETYLSRIEGAASAVVPITADAKSLERTSVILEALACESQNRVIPAYYDIALSVRATRDEESSEMLDIIFANRVFDFGDGLWFGDIRNGIFHAMFKANNRDIVSKLERLESLIQKLSNNAVEAFEQLK
ncbi:MAG: extracellular solute-binding protein [Oscillospiraceae bacterium]|nr:extracellular solute-binding protein [Oscillospiraceae bacterium]